MNMGKFMPCGSVIRVVISSADLFLLTGAGIVAGLMGSAGGITSLISYPALLAVGIPPLPANVTNAVALMGSFPGSGLGSRVELKGQALWLRRWAPVAVVGAVVGLVLLLSTPDRVFNQIVPYLLAAAALVLLAQPRISRWHEDRRGRGHRYLLPVGLFVVGIYSGYFGAGSGIMILALLLLTVDREFPRANALKNMILGVADVVTAVAFLLFGPVHVQAALAVGGGLLVGSFLGPSVARRVPGNVLRVLAALLGFGLAIWLWVAPR
jgi:uncharacterized membrane protein YfcA